MKKTILFLAVFGLAGMISAQLPTSQQSNSPTSNSFRMRVVEPVEGATILGTDFDVVLGPAAATPSGTSVVPEERKDSLAPTYQVWVDGKSYGNVPIGQNVLRITGVSYGPHKLVIAAKNTAGELIDRKEISVTTSATVVAETRSTQVTTQRAPAPAPAYVAPPAREPAAPALATAPAQPQYTTESSTLPKTATSYPLAALAGAALVAAGALLRRRVV